MLAIQGVADNRHWQGVSGSGVGAFEVPSNWQQGSVPGAADLAAFNNRVNLNWAITFNGATTNTTGSVVAPSANYETVFHLNQQVWSLTNNLYVWEGSGGRVTYSNGTIRTGSLGCETAPPVGSSLTNHAVIAFRGVQAEAVGASFGGTRTSFEGGSLSVSNVMNVGVSTNSARLYATVYLMNGSLVAVKNEVRIADGVGTTARVEVSDAEFRLGGTINYLGVNARSKGTLSLQLFRPEGSGSAHPRVVCVYRTVERDGDAERADEPVPEREICGSRRAAGAQRLVFVRHVDFGALGGRDVARRAWA